MLQGFREGELESLVGEVLQVCWGKHRNAVVAHQELRECFLEMLAILANRQSSAALELRDEVLRTVGG